jgi:Rps23 Pro-64 3,4-dihydroxylase Tpa1-like proline 4-hydroxylase
VRRRNWNVIHKDDLSELLLERTTRTQFIFPVPNRILIMRRGLWHKIGLVKSNAPFARCSVAGFFLPDA